MPCPEALGYTQGKTLGSGTYAKVKAAWSPFERKMVSTIDAVKDRVDLLDSSSKLARGRGWGWGATPLITTCMYVLVVGA